MSTITTKLDYEKVLAGQENMVLGDPNSGTPFGDEKS